MYPKLSIRETAAQVRSGALDPIKVAEHHLARIDHHNKSLNALCKVDPSLALRDAAAVRGSLAKAKTAARLAGVCFSAKESINVRGWPSGNGSKNNADFGEIENCGLINRAVSEGAVCIGKANQAEYGKSYYTENLVHGRTSNPFNPDYSPGGSGGGDSAAVAAGMASFGIGADAGGSIRVPANFCGLFGLFPTRGLLPEAGVSRATHTISRLLRGVGVITPYLDDCKILLEALAGYDAADPYSVSYPLASSLVSPKKKFLFFSELNGVKADEKIQDQVNKVVARLEDVGYTAEEKTPNCFSGCYETFIILAAQAALQFEDHFCTLDGASRRLDLEGPSLRSLRERVAAGLPPLTVEKLAETWRNVDQLRYQACRLFDHYDFIIAPVAATTPPAHNTTSYQVDGQTLESQQVFQFSSVVNVLGLPAVAFPTEISSSGLPLGLQIIGPRFSDRTLLAALGLAGYSNPVTNPVTDPIIAKIAS